MVSALAEVPFRWVKTSLDKSFDHPTASPLPNCSMLGEQLTESQFHRFRSMSLSTSSSMVMPTFMVSFPGNGCANDGALSWRRGDPKLSSYQSQPFPHGDKAKGFSIR
jgi:hypothetical protein